MKRMIFHVLQQAPSLSLLWVVCWLPAVDVRAADARKGSGPQTNQAAAASKVQEQGPPASPILSVIFDDPNGLFSFLSRRNISFGCTKRPGDSETGDRDNRGRFSESGGRRWRLGRRERRAAEILPALVQSCGRNQVGPAFQRQQARSRNQRQRADFPQGVETSMASLSSFKNGKVFLNGGIDMFFRYSEEPPSANLMPGIFGSQGLGLHFLVEAHEGSVSCEVG